jgi:hypothetical protein
MQPWGLPFPEGRILPFQIQRDKPGSADNITAFKVVDLDGNLIQDFMGQKSLIEVRSTTDKEYLIYSGSELQVGSAGMFYVYIKKGNQEFFSEVFKVCTGTFLKLEWWNTIDIAPLLYQTGFKNVLYLDSYLEVQEPDLQEEGNNNGQGDYVPTFQRLVHKHKFEAIVPDYLLDALALAQIHDNIQITDELGETVDCYQVNAATTYADNYLGTIKFDFEVTDAYIRTNCLQNITLIS